MQGMLHSNTIYNRLTVLEDKGYLYIGPKNGERYAPLLSDGERRTAALSALGHLHKTAATRRETEEMKFFVIEQ